MMERDEICIRLVLSKRQLTLGLALAAVFGLTGLIWSETLTMSAIYPSPSGLYKKLLVTADAVLARNSGTVQIGCAAPLTPAAASKLDVCGTIRVVDGGTLTAGKVLTSDAQGVATWQYATFAPDTP